MGWKALEKYKKKLINWRGGEKTYRGMLWDSVNLYTELIFVYSVANMY